MVTNISIADFYEKYQHENLDLIDVREVHEFHVICQGGVRSASACQFLSAQGLTVTNVEGGMNAWPGDVE